MIIDRHHKLDGGHFIETKFMEDLSHRTFANPPTIAVIHYTVGLGEDALAGHFKSIEYLSIHVLIGIKGTIKQMIPFNRVAYHCGVSSYKGREGCNNFALGIELENPGPVLPDGKGGWKTTLGAPWTGEVVEAKHASGFVQQWTHWGRYSDEQIDACAALVDLWRHHYGLIDVVGHEDISPRRKFDPGPAFPTNWLRSAVFGDPK